MFYLDPGYMVLLLVTGALSIWASVRVKTTFARYQKVRTRGGLTGAEVARAILARSGVRDVRVERVAGFLSDHYDPREKVLRLSPDVYGGTSVAAVGVAAHEVGHAIQHARGYWPLQVRSYLAPAASFGSNLGLIIAMMGLAFHATGLVTLGVIAFAAMVAFTLVTLPVELDASARAKALLPELGFVSAEEARGVRSVLGAAAMTYVAAAVSSVLTLLYFVMRARE
ncbi:MAG: zinc metallopeptidase [Myxococcales bacterium]|nr:zinc metallopeptidase [Myxococcales bacterium]MCB9731385.1 zinc metallopeptidase [Deltaproteobacteria bacterium]